MEERRDGIICTVGRNIRHYGANLISHGDTNLTNSSEGQNHYLLTYIVSEKETYLHKRIYIIMLS